MQDPNSWGCLSVLVRSNLLHVTQSPGKGFPSPSESFGPLTAVTATGPGPGACGLVGGAGRVQVMIGLSHRLMMMYVHGYRILLQNGSKPVVFLSRIPPAC